MTESSEQAEPQGSPHILIISAPYYEDVAGPLLEGATGVLDGLGISYELVTVEGALEIPQAFAAAVEAGLWPLYRSDPARAAVGEPPLKLDAGGTMKRDVKDFTYSETRFRMVQKLDPKRFDRLQQQAQLDAYRRTELYRQLAELAVKPMDAKPKADA